MARDAAFGAAIPVGGALLRSKPVQVVSDKILDYTPFLTKSRLATRNADELAKVTEARSAISALNDADLAAFKAAEQNKTNAYNLAQRNAQIANKRAVQEAADAANARNLTRDLTERQRVSTANALRETKIQDTRKTLAQMAGWDELPKDQMGAMQARKAVGKQYGALVEPHTFPADRLAALEPDMVKGLGADDTRLVQSVANDITALADTTGNLTGSQYIKLRSGITKKLKNATGDARDRLQAYIDELDNSLDTAVGPEIAEQFKTKRAQYSLGKSLEKSVWGKDGLDLKSAYNKVKPDKDVLGSRRLLTDALQIPSVEKAGEIPLAVPQMVPDVPFIPAPTPGIAPPLRELPKFEGEKSDWVKDNSIRGLAATFMGPSVVALPFAALAAKGGAAAANNKYARDITARVLRGINSQTSQYEDPPPLMITRGR
jgi:hypothetical protein